MFIRPAAISLALVLAPALAQPPAQTPVRAKQVVAVGKRHALIVGVGKASIPGWLMNPLPECLNDADSLAKTLEKSGYACTLLRDGKTEPTREAVIAALDRICADAGPNDQVLTYFSTHGGVDGGKPNVAMKDAFLYLSEVKQRLSGSQAVVRMIMLDCCRDQPAFPTETSEFRDIHIISACRPDEISRTGPNGLSVFTEVLLEGIDGCKADRVKDGRLDLDEILYYVDEHVPARLEKYEPGQRQNPTRTVVDPRSLNPVFALCDAPPASEPQPIATEGPVGRALSNDLIISSALVGKLQLGLTQYEMIDKMGKPSDDVTMDATGLGFVNYDDTPGPGDITWVLFEKGRIAHVLVVPRKLCEGEFNVTAARHALSALLAGRTTEDLARLARGLSRDEVFAKFGCPTAAGITAHTDRGSAYYDNVPAEGQRLTFGFENGKVERASVGPMPKSLVRP